MKTDETPKVVVDSDGYKRLLQSIFHWFRLAHGLERPGESTGSLYCSLCSRFLFQRPACWGCPVAQYAQVSGCIGTPYEVASRLCDPDKPTPGFRAAARKELEFLLDIAEIAKVVDE